MNSKNTMCYFTLIIGLLIIVGCTNSNGTSYSPAKVSTSTLTIPNTATLEIPPTITTTSTASPIYFIKINSDKVNKRSGPGTSFDVIGLAQWGEEYEVFATDQDETWLKLSRNEEVWISAKYATVIAELTQNATPVANLIRPTSTSSPIKVPTVKPPAAINRGLGVKLGDVRAAFEEKGLVFQSTTTDKNEYRLVSTTDRGETYFVQLDAPSADEESYLTSGSIFITTPLGGNSNDVMIKNFTYMNLFIDQVAPEWTEYNPWMEKVMADAIPKILAGQSSYEARTNYKYGSILFGWSTKNELMTFIIKAN